MSKPTYWLPTWWNWFEDWSRCTECLKYNHSPCLSCEIPPGILGLAQLVGGGTIAVAGEMRGNMTIATQRQAQAASRVSSRSAVQAQLSRQSEVVAHVQNNEGVTPADVNAIRNRQVNENGR